MELIRKDGGGDANASTTLPNRPFELRLGQNWLAGSIILKLKWANRFSARVFLKINRRSAYF